MFGSIYLHQVVLGNLFFSIKSANIVKPCRKNLAKIDLNHEYTYWSYVNSHLDNLNKEIHKNSSETVKNAIISGKSLIDSIKIFIASIVLFCLLLVANKLAIPVRISLFQTRVNEKNAHNPKWRVPISLIFSLHSPDRH